MYKKVVIEAQSNSRRKLNEAGFSLIEILFAIILLGISFTLLASFIYQNSRAIEINKKREEAIFVREDIKEWLLYKAQIQDITNLNQFVFVESGGTFSEEQTLRRKHMILDNSGIQKLEGSNKAKFGEVEMPLENNEERGTFVQKVRYSLTPTDLPQQLQSGSDYLYIGQYIDSSKKETEFLVKVTVQKKQNIQDYNPRTDGIALTILIYDQKTGSLLTETCINWVAES